MERYDLNIEFLHEKFPSSKQTYLMVAMDWRSFMFSLFKVYVTHRRIQGLRYW